jgi:hypothetical protein
MINEMNDNDRILNIDTFHQFINNDTYVGGRSDFIIYTTFTFEKQDQLNISHIIYLLIGKTRRGLSMKH